MMHNKIFCCDIYLEFSLFSSAILYIFYPKDALHSHSFLHSQTRKKGNFHRIKTEIIMIISHFIQTVIV